ncbi:MAG: SOS response-associated peptidase family protein, partial [Planctomycetota bacterium]
MCGRFTLATAPEILAEYFELDAVPDLPPRYNIAPTQPAPVILVASRRPGREFRTLRWGLIPSWANDPTIGNRMINARAETVREKPAFRSA